MMPSKQPSSFRKHPRFLRTQAGERTKIAMELRESRRRMWIFEGGYTTDRGLHYLQNHLVRLKEFLRQQFKDKPFRFLDLGAGIGRMGYDLRRVFGDQIHLTGIALNYPVRTKTQWKKQTQNIKKTLFINELPFEKKRRLDQLNAWKKRFRNAQKNTRAYDEFKVGDIARFQSEQKFDVLFDLFGPLTYSKNRISVSGLAKLHLKPGGFLISDSEHLLDQKTAPALVFSRQIGHLFVFQRRRQT